MNKFISTVNKSLVKLSHFLPHPLPVGVSEFERWSASIINTYGYPDNDSVRFALCTMVMHLGPTAAFKPKRYFALCLHKGMATQIAHSVMQELKAKQQAEAQKQSEATVQAAASDVAQ